MKPLRAAVIGVGLIGSQHAQIYLENPLSELIAICDSDDEQRNEIASRLGVSAYSNYTTLLEKEHLDLVSIATPEQHHVAPALAAAEHKLAILLEKPLTPSLEETDKLVSSLNALNAFVAVNFILHADPRYSSMKQLIRSGQLGQVATYFVRRRGTRLGLEKYAPWTDLLMSTAIHDIEMMLAINPAPPERVFAEAVIRQCEPYGSEDAVMGLIRFSDGTIGSLETSWILPPTQPELLDPAFHVVADRGGVFIDGASQGLRVLTKESYQHPDMTHWPSLPLGVGGALEHSLDAFLKAVAYGGAPLVGLTQARNAQEVVVGMKRSIENNMPVLLPLLSS